MINCYLRSHDIESAKQPLNISLLSNFSALHSRSIEYNVRQCVFARKLQGSVRNQCCNAVRRFHTNLLLIPLHRRFADGSRRPQRLLSAVLCMACEHKQGEDWEDARYIMDQFGPTGKSSEQPVQLSRWTTFLGWTVPFDLSDPFSIPIPRCSIFSTYPVDMDQYGRNRGYFMVGECGRFFFTSCERRERTSERSERVSSATPRNE